MDNLEPVASDSRQVTRVRLDPHGHWRRIASPSMTRCKEAFQSLLCFTGPTESSAVTAESKAGNAREPSPAHCYVNCGGREIPYVQAALQEKGAVQNQQIRPTEKEPASRKHIGGLEEKGGIGQDQRADGCTIVWYAPEDTYTPLYFGSSPEEDGGSGQSHDYDSFLQYAGAAVGAVSGLVALGIGFLFLAAGLAVEIGTKSVLAQYNTLQTHTAERNRRRAPGDQRDVADLH